MAIFSGHTGGNEEPEWVVVVRLNHGKVTRFFSSFYIATNESKQNCKISPSKGKEEGGGEREREKKERERERKI